MFQYKVLQALGVDVRPPEGLDCTSQQVSEMTSLSATNFPTELD